MHALTPELEGLPVGLLQVDLQGRIHAANACLRTWLGLTSAELVGCPVDGVLSRAGRVLYHTHLIPTLRLHSQVQEMCLSLQAPAGKVYVLCSGHLLHGGGEPLVQLVLSPMRERLRIEAELARVQRSAEAAPLALFECVRDNDGRAWLSYASAGLVSLYGLAPEAVHFSEQPWLDHIHPEDRGPLLASRDASARTRAIWFAQFRARAADGPWRWHRLHAQPYAEPDGRMVWYGTLTDVTDQLAVEGAERDRDTAEHASRSKTDFLARMSHELRTPLNAIIGFSHLMEQDPACADPQAHQRLGIIHTAGQQLLQLIDEVLDISRIEAGRLHLDIAPMALAPLAEEVCHALEPMRAAHGVALTLHAAPDLAVLADRARLRQVLSNLVSNALKYTGAHGCVRLELADAGEHVQLRVRDNGPGLTLAQQQQLFEPFNRLGAERGSVQGTGLGLVISRHLTESMGGTLRVQGQPGEGCCFIVELPLADIADTRRAPASPPAATAATAVREWQLLYAEDDPVNALLMEAVLARLPGVDLRIAFNGEAACALAQAERPDLVMLDMNLPDIDGCALLARLRSLPGLADVPAVAVSADAMPEVIERTLAAGFADYWTEPLDVDRLPAALDALLGQAGGPPDQKNPSALGE